VASKKTWKKRAKTAERIADEMFISASARATELAQIDTFLMELEIPGPDFVSWSYQLRDALVKLAQMRGAMPGPSLAPPESVVEPIPKVDSTDSPDGEYTFLQETDLAPTPRPVRDNPQA